MRSMREQKKSSVAGQADITVELPENRPYWRSNREFCEPKIIPVRQWSCGFWGFFRDDSLLLNGFVLESHGKIHGLDILDQRSDRDSVHTRFGIRPKVFKGDPARYL